MGEPIGYNARVQTQTKQPTIVEVTEYHIKHGKRGDCWACPVALALELALQHKVSVYLCFFQVGDRTYDLPNEVSQAMFIFDKVGRMEPFTFEVPHGC